MKFRISYYIQGCEVTGEAELTNDDIIVSGLHVGHCDLDASVF